LWFNFLPKKEGKTFRVEGPYEATGKEGKTFRMERPMSKEEIEEERLKAKAQELLFQVLGFRRS